MLCSTDTDRRISIGPIRIRGYVKFLQNLKAQRCIGVSDTDTRIRIGYVIRGHVEVSGLQSMQVWNQIAYLPSCLVVYRIPNCMLKF